MAAVIDYDKLEAFLRGDVLPEDLDTPSVNRFDITVFAYAVVVAHLAEFVYFPHEEELVLKDSIEKTLGKYFPYLIYGSHVAASRELGLHESHGRGRGSSLTLPSRFIELVNRYKDHPGGGIAKFTTAKRMQDRSRTEDGILPEALAQEVIARLRRCYGEEVLVLIRRGL